MPDSNQRSFGQLNGALGTIYTNTARYRWAWALGLAISAAGVVIAFRGVDLGACLHGLYSSNLSLVLLCVAMMMTSLGMRAIRWQLLFESHLTAPPLGRLFSVLMAGTTLNAIIPARAGDLARVYFLGQVASRTFVLTTIIIEKALDAGILLALAAAAIPLGIPNSVMHKSNLVIVIAVLTIFVVLMGTVALVRAFGLGRWKENRRFAFVQAAVEVLLQPRRAAAVISWSICIWVLNYIAIWASLKAVGLNLPLVAPIYVLVVQHLGSSLPSPGRIGTHQVCSMIALSPFGLSPAQVTVFSIVLYVSVVAIPLLIGALCLWREVPSLCSLTPAGQQPDLVAREV